MNEDRPRPSLFSKDEKPSPSWLQRIRTLFVKEPLDREELVDVLRDAQQKELLDVDGLSMIEGVLQVAEMQVRDIMIPRSQMVVVELEANPEQVLPVMIASAHSRFPVVGESRDEVLGILLAKDLLPYSSIKTAMVMVMGCALICVIYCARRSLFPKVNASTCC